MKINFIVLGHIISLLYWWEKESECCVCSPVAAKQKGVRRRRRSIAARKARIPHGTGLALARAIYWLSLCHCSWGRERAQKGVACVRGQDIILSKPCRRSNVIPSRNSPRIRTRIALPCSSKGSRALSARGGISPLCQLLLPFPDLRANLYSF